MNAKTYLILFYLLGMLTVGAFFACETYARTSDVATHNLLTVSDQSEESTKSTGRLTLIREKRGIGFSHLVLVGGTLFDHFSSYGMRNCYESNPVLGQTRARQAAGMAASTACVWFLTNYIERHGAPKAAKILRYTVGFVHVAAGAWNCTQRLRY